MRNLLNIFAFALCLFTLRVNAQFTDDFNDGDFTNGVVWSGNTADWLVVTGELRTNGPAITPTQIYLSTNSSTAMDAQWEFYVNPKCATSSGNYMNIVLISDQSNLLGNFNGYYVMVGNTADEISLYRKDGATNAIIINGTDGVIASSSNNPFKVKVIRDALGNWTLDIDNTGTGTAYINQGAVLDNTYTTSSFFGIMVNYSAANNVKYFADNIYVGPIIIDTTPPAIVSASIISSTQLDVDFDESLEQTSAENISNYFATNGLANPSIAQRDAVDFSLVHLTFASPFTPMQTNTLTVNGVGDLNGNLTVNETVDFTYIPLSTASYREVIVNEIFADPTPSAGLPTVEFLEIFNRSNLNFDLSGWTISDGSSTATFGNHILLPGEYLILCATADQTTWLPYGTTMGLNSFPSLNNSGDNLVLKNQNGLIIDQVNYSDTWYQSSAKAQGGWSLELINPTLDCSGSQNWIASNNVNGGSPGIQNSVYSNAPDLTAPEIISYSILTSTQIQVAFSENMDSLSLSAASWSINGGIGISSTLVNGPDFTNVTITFNTALDPATLYLLICNNASDCAGNNMSADSLQIGIGVDPQPYEIIINELFPDPDGSTALPESEFVELYNTTNKVIAISGYHLSDLSSTVTLPVTIIFPYDYVILTANANVADYTSYGKVSGLSSLPSLNNAGDEISLRSPGGQLIHKVNYNDSWYQNSFKAQGGWTLEMKDAANPCGTVSNWGASNDASGGTPGRINSIQQTNPDTELPYPVLAEAIDANTVIVTFSEIMDSVSLLIGNYFIDHGILVSGTSVMDDYSVSLTVNPPLQFQTIYTLNANFCSDCVGNQVSTSSTIQFALPDVSWPGDIIINEVLFDPRGSGADFVELYNNSPRFVSLKNWSLANYSNDTISNAKIISDNVLILYPGQYLAITTDSSNISSEYPFTHRDRLLQIESMPSYSNDAGRVILIDNTNRLNDDFEYSSDMHFALLQTNDGVSLERIDFNRPTSDNSNWHSAAESENYATPGYENSQLQPGNSNGTVNAEPATFSPDNDGYEDVVNITYQLDQSGYVGNITIYDAQGRIVRLLMRNELLSASGTISWDGINEKREKANAGAYVIYMEIFDLNGNVKHYKKGIVLATKF